MLTMAEGTGVRVVASSTSSPFCAGTQFPPETTLCEYLLEGDLDHVVLKSPKGGTDGRYEQVIPPCEAGRVTPNIVAGLDYYAGAPVRVDGQRVGVFATTQEGAQGDDEARVALVTRCAGLVSRQLQEVRELQREYDQLEAEVSEIERRSNAGALEPVVGDEVLPAPREPPVLPPHYGERDAALAALGITPQDLVDLDLDQLAEDCAIATGAEMVLINLLSDTKQFVVAASSGGRKHGIMSGGDAPIEDSYCIHVLRANHTTGIRSMTIADSRLDERTRESPFTNTIGLRSYAGAVVEVDSELSPVSKIGVICATAVDTSVGGSVHEATLKAFATMLGHQLSAKQRMVRNLAFHEVDPQLPKLTRANPSESEEEVEDRLAEMTFRQLLAKAQQLGLREAEAAESRGELLRMVCKNVEQRRQRRSALHNLQLSELFERGAHIPGFDKLESRKQMIDVLLGGSILRSLDDKEGISDDFRGDESMDGSREPDAAPTPKGILYAAEWLDVLPTEPIRFSLDLPEFVEGRARVSSEVDWTKRWSAPWPRPPLPEAEKARLDAVARLQIVGHDLNHTVFDDFARSIVSALHAETVTVTVVDDEYVFMLGEATCGNGLYVARNDSMILDRIDSVDAWALACPGILWIPDLTAEPALEHVKERADLLAVTLVRGCVSCPIVVPGGQRVGVLSVGFAEPLEAPPQFGPQLAAMARVVAQQLELRALRLAQSELLVRRSMALRRVNSRLVDRTNPPRSDVTLVFTDIEASTTLWSEHPEAASEAQRLHDNLIREAVSAFAGFEVTTEGDAFFVAFHLAEDAVKFAFEVQRQLMEVPWPAEIVGSKACPTIDRLFRGLRVRILIHTVLASDGTIERPAIRLMRHATTRRPVYRGSGVDLATAVSNVPRGGQVVVTGRTFETLSARMGVVKVAHIVHLGQFATQAGDAVGPLYELGIPGHLALREFPPLRHDSSTLVKVGPGYHDVKPGPGQPITVAYVYPYGLTEIKLKSDLEYVAALQRFTSKVRATAIRFGGHEMNELEGAFLWSFLSREKAVSFGDAVHRALAEKPVLPRAHALCALATGVPVRVQPREGTGRLNFFGGFLNLGARLAKAAHPGQTLCDTETVGEQPGHGITDLGLHRFRGMGKLVHVMQLGEREFPQILSLTQSTGAEGALNGDEDAKDASLGPDDDANGDVRVPGHTRSSSGRATSSLHSSRSTGRLRSLRRTSRGDCQQRGSDVVGSHHQSSTTLAKPQACAASDKLGKLSAGSAGSHGSSSGRGSLRRSRDRHSKSFSAPTASTAEAAAPGRKSRRKKVSTRRRTPSTTGSKSALT